MLRKLLRKFRFWQIMTQDQQVNNGPCPKLLTPSLSSNLAALLAGLGNSSDIVTRSLKLGAGGEIEAALVFVDGLVDKEQINDNILKPLMVDLPQIGYPDQLPRSNLISIIQASVLTIGEIKIAKDEGEIVAAIVTGETALIIEGFSEALILDTKHWETRAIEQPETEAAVRGPREGFTETLRTTTAMLRRKIRDPNLTFDGLRLGERTKTDVAIAYLKGLTNDRLVVEIKRRLQRIRTDAILESGYIEEFIEDNPFSPFPTIGNSEKPDKVAAKLLEGRAAILVDGTPFVLTVPTLFVENFQATEDYYGRWGYRTFLRWIKYLAFVISLIMPAVYVALTTFHQELIPTSLLITFAAAREGIPFPAVVEALGMIITFEILREAGIRAPRSFSQTISIVGALVIGETVVAAGLIGAPMVVVVSGTAIASFAVPSLEDAGALLRIGITIMAGAFGLYGILICFLVILVHLASIRSFGAPFMSPLMPLSPGDLKDVAVRAPMWAMLTRPRAFARNDPQRQEFRLQPEPPRPADKPASFPKRKGGG